jgi:predicted GIY-YIG superfamily endonuclease
MTQPTGTLYALRLKGEFFYAGTTGEFLERLQAHASGEGSAWTKMHPYVNVEYAEALYVPATQLRLYEDMKVKELMLKHGIDKVRGGSYSSVTLSSEQRTALEVELRHSQDRCLQCGSSEHWVADCPSARKSVPKDKSVPRPSPATPKEFCHLCGDAEHTRELCPRLEEKPSPAEAASKKLSSKKVALEGAASEEGTLKKKGPCTRCGRDNHQKSSCYAKTHKDGSSLSD